MSVNALFNIGRTALQASQLGLQVAGNNIANVNSPNYSRQDVVLQPGVMVNVGGVGSATGVEVTDVRRAYDAFLGFQLHAANAATEDYELRERIDNRMESVVYPSAESNIGLIMDDFFNGWQDLAMNPSGSAERQVVLARAEDLASNFRNSLNRFVEQEMRYSNDHLEMLRDEVNGLAAEIASLNREILRSQGQNMSRNDLLDRKDELLQQLSGYLDLTLFEQESGTVTVLISGGQPLVDGGNYYPLELDVDQDNNNFYNVEIRGHNITDSINNGKIKAVLEGRDKAVEIRKDLDLLAASLIKEVNLQHEAGRGLDGLDVGRPFFSDLNVTTRALATNQGTATVFDQAIVPGSLNLVTLDDYEIQITNSGANYVVTNTNEGTTAATGAYASLGVISFDGLSIRLTGAPVEGDVFRVSTTEGAARDIQVAISSIDEIAAAQTVAGLPGDNQNAIAMANLSSSQVLHNSTTTLSGHYQSIVGNIGAAAQDASRGRDAKEILVNSMEAHRDSISGVSLEEEEIRLIAFQHSYAAASRYMTAVDQMLEHLLMI